MALLLRIGTLRNHNHYENHGGTKQATPWHQGSFQSSGRI
jgi:hypothetical protein